MKQKLLLLVFLVISVISNAQTTVFIEDFESLPLNVTTSGLANWARTTNFYSNGNYADSAHFVNSNDSAIMVSSSFSTLGKMYVMLSFDHICKTEFFDGGFVEVSVDNGVNWIKLLSSEYLGTGNYAIIGNHFSAASYLDWDIPNNATVPNQSWWKNEHFDLSALASNKANVKIRFILRDGNYNGPMGNFGWIIDNIKVTASIGEIVAPSVALEYPILADSVYHNGPYDVYAKISDASGVSQAKLVYSVLNNSDTLSMIKIDSTTYKATIPSQSNGSIICYSIFAIDSSLNHNIGHYPSLGCKSFRVVKPLVESQIGYSSISTNVSPMYIDSIQGNNRYSKHISIFTSKDLNKLKGDIVKLAFKKTNSLGYLHTNAQLKVYLKHTGLTSVPAYAAGFNNEIAGSTLVFDKNDFSLPYSNSWVELLFNDTFNYNGTDNLMMLVSWYYPDSASGNLLEWENSVANGKAITFYGNNSNPSIQIGENLRPNTKFFIDPYVFKYDLSMHKVENPLAVDYNFGTTDFRVNIKNNGSEILTKGKIKYSIDGIQKPDYFWTGNLQADIVTLPITIGSIVLSPGSHILKVWTELPNDSADQNLVNDTILFPFYHCDQSLNGTYTLGGVGANFQTLQEVENKFNNCGISGPVTILINPGVYDGNIEINNQIVGINNGYSITIKSVTNNANDVFLNYTAQSLSDNFIIKVNDVSNVTIKHLTFNPIGFTQTTAITFTGKTQNCLVDHCNINFEANSSSNNVGFILFGNGSSNNTFTNNTITNASTAVNTSQNYVLRSVGNVFSYNTCKNIKGTGFMFYNEDSLTISNNVFQSTLNSVTFTGIDLEKCGAGVIVSNNKISAFTNSGKGIHVSNCSGYLSSKIKIFNNFVSYEGSFSGSTINGLLLNNSDNVQIAYNSFMLKAGGSLASTILINNQLTNYNGGLEFLNNIISNFAGGLTIESSQAVVTNNLIATSDHNCFYTSGSYIAKYGAIYLTSNNSLTSLIGATLKDSNSVFSNPKFYSSQNLHAYSINIDGKAKPIATINNDIDGNTRNLLTPDIGADEFSLSSIDAGTIELIEPFAIDTQNRVCTMKALVQNFGTDTIHTMQIKYSVNGASPQLYTWNGTLLPSASDTLSVGSFSVPALNYTLSIYTQLAQDSIFSNDTITANLFGLPLVDLRISRLITPINACNMSANETVKVKIVNLGVGVASSGFPVSYQVLGSPTVKTETVLVSIAPKDSIDFTFSSKTNMVVTNHDSLFNFLIYPTHNQDPNHANDSAIAQVISLSLLPKPIISDTSILYGDTVKLVAQSNFSTNWYADSITSIPIASGNSFTTPVLFDTTSFYVEANSNIPAQNRYIGTDTTTNAAGSNVCVYEGDGGLHQILILASELQAMGMVAGNINGLAFYIQSTNYNTNHAFFGIKMGLTNATSLTTTFITAGLTTVFQSAFTEITGWNNHNFTAPFYWNGTSNIILDFEIYTNNSNPLLRSSNTPFASVAYAGVGAPGVSTLRPNIRFATASVLGCNGFREKVTVNVTKPQYDVYLKNIIEPSISCGIGTAAVKIRIKNNGTDPIPGGYSVSYKINNGNYSTPEIITQNLFPADSLDYTFQTLANLPSGSNGTNYTVTAKISANNDSYAGNDTVRKLDIFSDYTPVAPSVTSPVIATYGTTVQLNASALDTVYWYSNSNLNTQIGSGNSVLVGPLYDTITYYTNAIKTAPVGPYLIGNGVTTNSLSVGPSPFGAPPTSVAFGLKNQFLIRASEMRAMGMMKGEISSIAFNNLNAVGLAHLNYTIQIGTTTQNELTKIEKNLTQVYTTGSYQDVVGWNTFNFSTPFYWDGVSNIVVQTCFKNTSWVTSGYASTYCITTPHISSVNSYTNNNFQCYDTTITNPYYKRPNVRFMAKGYGSCPSPATAVVVNVSGIPTVDAAILKIAAPSNLNSISAGAISPVRIVLKNYGTDTLKSATIHWTLKGIAQTNYLWTGSLSHNAFDTITIGSPIFTGGTTNILAWVSNPNNFADTVNTNDTAFKIVNVCMGGIYTIGVNGANYSTFSNAINDMLVNSICSPTVFIVDSGTYVEQILVPRIPGASETNTVLFKGAQADSNSVKIPYGNGPTNNFVLKFKNASYVSFKHMSFTANGGAYANVVVFEDTTHHCGIYNSMLMSSNTNTSGTNANCVFINSKLPHHIYIENNAMLNGVNSVYTAGEFATRLKSVTIKNNVLSYFYNAGIFANYVDSIVAIGNQITSGSTSGTYYGINLQSGLNYFKLSGNTIALYPLTLGFGISISNGDGLAAKFASIDNNFINILSGSGDNKGISLLNSCDNINLVYNTVRLGSGNLLSAALFSSTGTNQYLKNNIFYATYGFTLYTSNPSVFSYCNYNNYGVDTLVNTKFVFWMSDVANLTNLKALDINKNSNSYDYDPIFNSTTDLHINEILLKSKGSPIVSYTTDIDGEIRHASTPDIGADEFLLPSMDIAVFKLVSPMSACQLGNQEVLKVKIRNLGINSVQFSTNPVTFTVTIAGPSGTDTITEVLNTGSINSGMFMDYTFSALVNFSANAIYTVDVKISMPSDGKILNNHIGNIKVKNVHGINTLPFSEGFETGSNLSFNESRGNETTINVNAISASSGAYGLHLTGGSLNNYLYPSTVNQAFAQTSRVAKVYSCSINAVSVVGLTMKFDLKQTYYALNLPNTSMLRVMVTDSVGVHYLKNVNGDSVFKAATPNLDAFTTQVFNLNAYKGQNISVSVEAYVFRAYASGSSNSDNVYIDNFSIWVPSLTDVGVRDVLSASPHYGMVNDTRSISVIVDNFGTDTLTQIPLALRYNGGLLRDTLYTNLLPNSFASFTFANQISIVPGKQKMEVFTELLSDGVHANDSTFIQFTGMNVIPVDYATDFEGQDDWLQIGTKSQWELGTPSSPNINSAKSGLNAWKTVLAGNYKNNSTEYLYTPYFVIPQILDSVQLEFWHKLIIPGTSAYGTIQYSTDGIYWANLGYQNYIGAVNWYSTAFNGNHAWGQSINNWTKSSIKLDPSVFNTATPFQIRYVFKADASINTLDGWVIDDFKLKVPKQPIDAGIISFLSPVDSLVAGDSISVQITLKNYGSDTLYSIPLMYKVGGSTPVNATWNGTLPSNDTAYYTFATKYIQPVNSYLICAATSLASDVIQTNDSLCKNVATKPAAIDGGVSLILTPHDSIPMNNQNSVKIRIRNFGINTLSNIPVSYTVNGNIISSEVFAGSIAKGDSVDFTFATKFFSPIGSSVKVCAKTSILNDNYKYNDSTCTTLKLYVGFGKSENFGFELGQNIPNPSSQTTEIPYSVIESGTYRLRIVSLLGDFVFDREYNLTAGSGSISLDVSHLAPGAYFYILENNGVSRVRKMIIQ